VIVVRVAMRDGRLQVLDEHLAPVHPLQALTAEQAFADVLSWSLSVGQLSPDAAFDALV
jgi:hypothetical protein